MQFNSKQIYLPVAYFFLLSMGLILSCSYILISSKDGNTTVYAKSVEDVKLSKNSEKQLQPENELQKPNDITAQKIDAFFTKHKAPLASYGNVFTSEARKNQIDTTLVAAIAWCESNGGKVTPQFGGKESYNAWGYAVYDNNNTTKQMNAYDMGSWDNGIAILSRAMRKNYDRGLIEPEELVTRYTPASVQKSDGNPNLAPWTMCVKSTMQKIAEIEVDK